MSTTVAARCTHTAVPAGGLSRAGLHHRAAERGRAFGDVDAGRTHRLDLGRRGVAPAGDDRAGMAHAPPGRGGDAGDEADDRLLHLVAREELGGVLLGAAADLADHDDRLGLGVGQEHLQHVDEVGALHRVAADADAGGLAEPGRGGLRHRLVGQRAGARDDADRAAAVDVARHDADLAFVRA